MMQNTPSNLKFFLILAALLSISAGPALAAKSGDVAAGNATLRADSNCVNLTMVSKGEGIESLLGASTSIAKTAVLIDQRMHRDVPRIELLPGKPVTLEDGGACIILRELKRPAVGSAFPLTLVFAKAGNVTVNVKTIAGEAPIVTQTPRPAPQTPKVEPKKDETPAKKDESAPATPAEPAATPAAPATEPAAAPAAEEKKQKREHTRDGKRDGKRGGGKDAGETPKETPKVTP
jgi:copper(I)-binding protein